MFVFSQDSLNECRGFVRSHYVMACWWVELFVGLGHSASSDFYAAHVFTLDLHCSQLACSLPRHPRVRSACSNRGYFRISFLIAPGGARSPEEPPSKYIFLQFRCVCCECFKKTPFLPFGVFLTL